MVMTKLASSQINCWLTITFTIVKDIFNKVKKVLEELKKCRHRLWYSDIITFITNYHVNVTDSFYLLSPSDWVLSFITAMGIGLKKPSQVTGFSSINKKKKKNHTNNRLNCELKLKRDNLDSINNPPTSGSETAEKVQPRNVKAWWDGGCAVILTPRRSVRTRSERDGGGEDSLRDVWVYWWLAVSIKHRRQDYKEKEGSEVTLSVVMMSINTSVRVCFLPLLVLVCGSPALSHTPARNSLTCFRDSELCSVSKG